MYHSHSVQFFPIFSPSIGTSSIFSSLQLPDIFPSLNVTTLRLIFIRSSNVLLDPRWPYQNHNNIAHPDILVLRYGILGFHQNAEILSA